MRRSLAIHGIETILVGAGGDHREAWRVETSANGRCIGYGLREGLARRHSRAMAIGARAACFYREYLPQLLESFKCTGVIDYASQAQVSKVVYQAAHSYGVFAVADVVEHYDWSWHYILNGMNWQQMLLRQAVLPRMDGIIGISRGWCHWADQRGIPNVWIPAFAEDHGCVRGGPSSSGQPFTIAFIGHWLTRELPMVILDAVRICKKRGLLVHLQVMGKVGGTFGEKPVEWYLRKYPEIAKQVAVLGFVSDRERDQHLANADAFVLLRPHSRETDMLFPTRLPEYMLSGNPVVLSEVGCFPDCFTHRKDVWFVSRQNSPKELADALVHLATHAEERLAIGERGRQTALEQFSLDVLGQRLAQFLAETAGRQPTRKVIHGTIRHIHICRKRRRRFSTAPLQYSSPIRILFVTSGATAGGAERQLLCFLKQCNRDRFRPSVLTVLSAESTMRRGGNDFRNELSEMGVPYRSLDLDRFPTLIGMARLLLAIRVEPSDLIQTYGLAVDLAVRVCSPFLGHRGLIGSIRGPEEQRHPLLFHLDGWTSWLLDGYISNSRAGAEALICKAGVRPERITIVPNGLDCDVMTQSVSADARPRLRAAWGVPPGALVAVTVANLHDAKGHTDLVRAASLCARDNLLFVLVGEDRSAGGIAAQVNRLGLTDRFRFLGVRRDIADVLSAADIFVLPSHWEGMSNALMEAMASALPCIATRVGAAAELLDEGHAGILVPPRDPGSLARELCRLADDPMMRQRLANAAHERIRQEYATCRMVNLHEAFYERKGAGQRVAR
jgi:glycosyltransferase involved in cell wall biosynthesis